MCLGHKAYSPEEQKRRPCSNEESRHLGKGLGWMAQECRSSAEDLSFYAGTMDCHFNKKMRILSFFPDCHGEKMMNTDNIAKRLPSSPVA